MEAKRESARLACAFPQRLSLSQYQFYDSIVNKVTSDHDREKEIKIAHSVSVSVVKIVSETEL